MAIQLGSAYGKVNLDASGVSAGVNSAVGSLKNLQQVGLQVGAAMKQVGQTLTIGVTLPILAAGAASIKAASDLEETRNKVKVVFGDMSADVLEWGENAALAFGQSKQQALEAAGTFGNLFTTMGLGKNASAEMSTSLVELAADLASFNNMDPAIVLEKLRSGLVGEVEPLRTLGINLTAAAVKAKAMEMGLADANGEVSQAAMVQARYALILEQTSNAQGDFARTSDGMANQSRIMTAQLKDAAATLGQNLLPMALAVVQGLNRMLEAFNNAPPFVQKAILVFLGLAALAGPILSFIGTILTLVSTLGTMGVSLGTVASVAGTAATAMVGLGASTLVALWPLLLIIGTLVLVYLAFKNNFGGITTTVQQGWFLIKLYSTQGWQSLKAGSAEGWANLKAGWSEAIASMQSQITGWIDWLRNAWQNVLTYLGDVRNRIIETFRNVDWGAVGMGIINAIANGIFGGIPGLINAALQAAQSAWDAAQSVFSGSSASSAASPSSASPNDIARSMVKPANNSSSNQANVTMQFENGVSVRQVREMMEMNNEAILRHLNYVLGA